MANGLVEPADEQKQKRCSADRSDAAEDQALRAGQEDIAVISNAPGAGEMEAVLGEANLIFVRAKEDCLSADEEEANGDAVRVKALGRAIVCQSITIRPMRRKPRMANAKRAQS